MSLILDAKASIVLVLLHALVEPGRKITYLGEVNAFFMSQGKIFRLLMFCFFFFMLSGWEKCN